MKNKCLVIRYGELFLKGKNKNDFIEKLVANIRLAWQKNNFSNFNIKKLSDQLLITAKNEEDLTKMMVPLTKVFGISVFYLAYQLENSLEKLEQFVRNIANYYQTNPVTFKFDISRNNKNFPKNSATLQKELGEIIVKNHGLKVNLSNPQTTFYIRIYQQFILFFNDKKKGLGGLPVGSSGQILLLLSGGIDSPVAGYHLMKRGLEIIYLHFYYEKEGQEKIIALIEKLSPYNNYSNSTYLIDIQPFFTEIRHISQEKYRLIILKRMFIRLACSLVQKLKIRAIATGDSLAQVASQTLESLVVIQQASITAFEQIKSLTQKINGLHQDLEEKAIVKNQKDSFFRCLGKTLGLIKKPNPLSKLTKKLIKIKSKCQELEKVVKKIKKEEKKQVILITPLISYDKEEVIKEAKKIGTYELSLNKYQDCCSLFEPKHPITKPKKEIVEKLENEILWQEILEIIFKQLQKN